MHDKKTGNTTCGRHMSHKTNTHYQTWWQGNQKYHKTRTEQIKVGTTRLAMSRHNFLFILLHNVKITKHSKTKCLINTNLFYWWSTNLFARWRDIIHGTCGSWKNQIPWIQLKRCHWQTPCPYCWFLKSLIQHNLWCQFPWQMQYHTWLWKSSGAMDGIHYSSLQCLRFFLL